MNVVPAVVHSGQEVEIAGNHFTVSHPSDYVFEVVNLDLNEPRMLYFHGDEILVGSRDDRIYRLYPPYDQVQTLAHLPLYPHSMLIRDDEIIIARTHGVFKAKYSSDPNWRLFERDLELLVPLEPSRSHSSRTIGLGPDDRLYVSIGMPGNCDNYYLDESYPETFRRGGLFVIDENSQPARLIPYVSGLRNPVGFDWQPDSNTLYITNNGPDHLGYEQPLEYFARGDEGSFHGMPWYQFDGNQLFEDPCASEFQEPLSIQSVPIPAATFEARSAPLGMSFVTDQANATEFYGDAIVAIHGSWATSTGSFYGEAQTRREPKLVRVDFEDSEIVGVVDLLTGFQLENGKRWARPAGVAIGSDGDIYFTSDDAIEGLYRLRKRK
ncbi:MAG: PQQ-dependent sugar dehydrogenase [Gammaproteobacteria bacterium]|nr:PQQ-dependent sugar dehydrogenase [Gammaproteobacteria bacterium]MCY4219272.1 PQQ-dependent sugar dehydrogenase [Gammaproteobacteria bacterium]MCY4274282.1 PQQ-dependent sugar dehydrogenase [Gammaproteobacteria bacterium]